MYVHYRNLDDRRQKFPTNYDHEKKQYAIVELWYCEVVVFFTSDFSLSLHKNDCIILFTLSSLNRPILMGKPDNPIKYVMLLMKI